MDASTTSTRRKRRWSMSHLAERRSFFWTRGTAAGPAHRQVGPPKDCHKHGPVESDPGRQRTGLVRRALSGSGRGRGPCAPRSRWVTAAFLWRFSSLWSSSHRARASGPGCEWPTAGPTVSWPSTTKAGAGTRDAVLIFSCHKSASIHYGPHATSLPIFELQRISSYTLTSPRRVRQAASGLTDSRC